MEAFIGKMQTRRQIACFALGTAQMQTFKLEKLPFPSVAPLSHYINYWELFTYFPSFRAQVQTLWIWKMVFILFTGVKKQYMEIQLFFSKIQERGEEWHPNIYFVLACFLVTCNKT